MKKEQSGKEKKTILEGNDSLEDGQR